MVRPIRSHTRLLLPAAACLALIFSACRSQPETVPAAVLEKLTRRPDFDPQGDLVLVSLPSQRLYLFHGLEAEDSWPVSTSAAGCGAEAGSGKTPPGTHRILHKFGGDAPAGTVFIARQNTGRIAHIFTDTTDVEEDLITSRIMWLAGLEPGINRGEGIDSFKRFIYIHGTNEEGLIGTPASHGCIRMKNDDVIELYSRVQEGTLVEIIP